MTQPPAPTTAGPTPATAGHAAPPRIQELRLGLTNACNLHCRHCYANSGVPDPDELTVPELASLLDRLAEHGTNSLSVTGGEPLVVYPKLLALVARARQHRMHVRINTSAVLLTEPRVAELAAAGVGKFQISLNGASPATHDAVVGMPGAFAGALCAARAVVHRGLALDFRFTVSRRTLGDVEACYDLAADVGAAALKLRLLLPAGRTLADSADLIAPAELTAVLRRLVARRSPGGPRLVVGQPAFPFLDPTLPGVQATRCLCGESYAYVSCRGDVFPCLFLVHLPQWCVGNIREHDIVSLWENAPILTALRSRYPASCHGCPHFAQSGCRNGCFALNLLVRGRPSLDLPACQALGLTGA